MDTNFRFISPGDLLGAGRGILIGRLERSHRRFISMNDRTNRPHLEALEGGGEGAGGPRLYRVHTTASAFEYDGRRYDDVWITWLAKERDDPPLPYAEVVEGWERLETAGPGEPRQQKEYAKAAVDELFTLEEARAWCSYLEAHYQDETAHISLARLPLEIDAMPLSVVSRGSGEGLVAVPRLEGYPFTFKVLGRFQIAMVAPSEADSSGNPSNPHRFGLQP